MTTYLRVFGFLKITSKLHFFQRNSENFISSFSHEFSPSSSKTIFDSNKSCSNSLKIKHCEIFFNSILPFPLFIPHFQLPNFPFLSQSSICSPFNIQFSLIKLSSFIIFFIRFLDTFQILFHSFYHTNYLVNSIFIHKKHHFFTNFETFFQPIFHHFLR